mmetsp:Transcript_68456/g.190340  ORF Transcript_68456/g.190340 Transcript_68456/m.190340 type:complete len:192 (-) Transcript_68456:500-1075(-)
MTRDVHLSGRTNNFVHHLHTRPISDTSIMSSSSDRDRAQAHTDNFFANGGNNNDDGQDLVWNPATGTFDTSGSSSMGGQMDVMVSTTKDGHFASAAQGDDMVFNEATGEFVAASLAATPQATEVQEAVPAHPAMMDVMKSTTKDGHFGEPSIHAASTTPASLSISLSLSLSLRPLTTPARRPSPVTPPLPV